MKNNVLLISAIVLTLSVVYILNRPVKESKKKSRPIVKLNQKAYSKQNYAIKQNYELKYPCDIAVPSIKNHQ